MFEKASRLKLRFETAKGNLSVEDLWDLPLISRASYQNGGVDLDTLAKALHQATKASKAKSFVVKRSAKDTVLSLKFDIVKHIIAVKLREKDEADAKLVAKQQNEKIRNIIAKKEDEELENLSVKDLKKMLTD